MSVKKPPPRCGGILWVGKQGAHKLLFCQVCAGGPDDCAVIVALVGLMLAGGGAAWAPGAVPAPPFLTGRGCCSFDEMGAGWYG